MKIYAIYNSGSPQYNPRCYVEAENIKDLKKRMAERKGMPFGTFTNGWTSVEITRKEMEDILTGVPEREKKNRFLYEMKYSVNLNRPEQIDDGFSLYEDIDIIEINIRPVLLPLFYQRNKLKNSRRELENLSVLRNIKKHIDIVEGAYLQDTLTGKTVRIKDGKYIRHEAKQFVEKLHNLYYEEDFAGIKPSLVFDGREHYSQFKGKPASAAHFLLQRYLETDCTSSSIVCEDVLTISDKTGKPVRIDFTFGYYIPDTSTEWEKVMPRMSRRHLNDFRIYKRFPDKHLRALTRKDIDSIQGVEVDFAYVIQILKRTCTVSNISEVGNNIVYRHRNTGWHCIFAKRDNPARLEMMMFYNCDIAEDYKDHSSSGSLILSTYSDWMFHEKNEKLLKIINE
jgi:hypothetical protein